MQREPSDRERIGGRVAVDRVAEHRVVEEREVDADLVGAAGPELGLYQGDGPQALERPQHGARRAAAAARGERGSPRPRLRPPDAALDQLLLRQGAAGQRQVPALDRVHAELDVKVLRRRVRKREHQHAGGVAVEAVNDEDAAMAAGPPLQLGRGARQDRVLLRGDGGVDEQPGGLVDDCEVLVGEQHLDRRRFGHAGPARQGHVVRHRIVRADEGARIRDDGAVDQHVADEHLVLGPGVGGAEQGLGRPAEAPRGVFHRASLAPMPGAVDTPERSG